HGPIPCRFSSPNTTRVSPVAGTSFEQIDATIYTGPELLDIVAGADLPVRFTTVYPGWAGTYELRTRPRMICGETSPVRHCECDVIGVQNP
ncbi:MAG TPA: hypothetical protein O0X27_05145, partial [Methanocorpusculum sp.]|nr:hypothetical protein [Methanocorpusculum sp.]